MELRKAELTEPLETIYLGGGTPSQLSAAELHQIFDQMQTLFGHHFSDNMEVTIECNPDDVSTDFCKQLCSLPINRVSMGAQTFSDERLRFLHRRHKAVDVAKAVNRLRQVGIQNISIDLMFGFPEETIVDWSADIDRAIALGVEHLSAYSLMYEEDTALHLLLLQGKVKETDEELYRLMYDMLIDRLTSAGYEHYEISNFAHAGYRSRHNSSYWNGKPYIGLGAAAHSYDVKTRSWNVDNIDDYIKGITSYKEGETSHSFRTIEIIDEPTRYDDLIVTALRTREGIFLPTLSPQQQIYLKRQAAPFLHSGKMRLYGDRLSLTREGIYVSDSIMTDLMWE